MGSLVDASGFLTALSLLLVDKFNEAFEGQQCNLLFEDVSHTFFGTLFPVASGFWGAPMRFEDALEAGLEAVSRGEKVVVAFSYTVETSGQIYALCLRKSDVEQLAELGRQLLRQLKSRPDTRMLVDWLSRVQEPDEGTGPNDTRHS